MYTCNKIIFVYIGPEMFQVPKYLAHVDRRLKEENDRLLHYLDQSTRYVSIECFLNHVPKYIQLYTFNLQYHVLTDGQTGGWMDG